MVKITCKGADTILLDDILEFQGDLKDLETLEYEKLKEKILKYGFSFPFFIWKNGNKHWCLDGHQRKRALIRMRDAEKIPMPERFPCDYIEAASLAEAKRKVLAAASQFGKMTGQGLYDFMNEAGIEFKELKDDFRFAEIDFKKFESEFIDKTEEVEGENEIPAARPTTIQRGDIFTLGNHRLLCGDSTDAEALRKLMDGEVVDMVFTDPPYRMEAEGGSNQLVGKAARKLGERIKHLCDFDPVKFLTNLPTVFEKGVMNAYIFCNKDLVPDYLNWGIENGYSFNILFWKKPNAIPLGGSHRPDVEYLLLFRKSAIWNNGLGGGVNYSRCLEFSRELSKDHPTLKPVGLIENELKISSNKDSFVLDFFLGSGSTLIACEKAQRKCLGMELDPSYCQVIIDRWEKFTGLKAMKYNGAEVQAPAAKLRKK